MFETRFVDTRPTGTSSIPHVPLLTMTQRIYFSHLSCIRLRRLSTCSKCTHLAQVTSFCPLPPIDPLQSLPPVPPLPLDITTKANEIGKVELPPLSTSVQLLDGPSTDSDSGSIPTPPPESDTTTTTPEGRQLPADQLTSRVTPPVTRVGKPLRPRTPRAHHSQRSKTCSSTISVSGR